jgi:hypothetical protein
MYLARRRTGEYVVAFDATQSKKNGLRVAYLVNAEKLREYIESR